MIRRSSVAIVWLVLLAAALTAGLACLPESRMYWQVVGRHAWQQATFRDTQFPWQQRVDQSVLRWQRDVLPNIADPQQRVAAIQAAAALLSHPELAADGADPVLTLLSDRSGRMITGTSAAMDHYDAIVRRWLQEAARLAPGDPAVTWQRAATLRWRMWPPISHGQYRELLHAGHDHDPENAFWQYLLAATPAEGSLFAGVPAHRGLGQGSENNAPGDNNARTAPPPENPVISARQEAIKSTLAQAGMGWSLSASFLTPMWVRDPARFADAAARAIGASHYRHPQAALHRRLESAVEPLGLSPWSRARFKQHLADEFPSGQEFRLSKANGIYQPTFAYLQAELLVLRDALVSLDGPGARAAYRRVVALFEHLWNTYPNTALRKFQVDEFLSPMLALLSRPAVVQTGCFPADFVREVNDAFGDYVSQVSSMNGNAPSALTGGGPFAISAPSTAGSRKRLVFFDGVARAGLALLISGGILWLGLCIWRRLSRRKRAELPTASWTALRWLPLTVVLFLIVALGALEGALNYRIQAAPAVTPAEGAERPLFIAWVMFCSVLAVIAATMRASGAENRRHNVGAFAFGFVLLGGYFATLVFGTQRPDGNILLPWDNVVHFWLDPTRGRSYHGYLGGRELGLLLVPAALVPTSVLGYWCVLLLKLWRGRNAQRKRASAVDAPEGPHRTHDQAARPADLPMAAQLPKVCWFITLATLCVALWGAVVLCATWRSGISLPPFETEQEQLRAAVNSIPAGPKQRPTAGDVIGSVPVDVALRLGSTWGFWQFFAGTALLTGIASAAASRFDRNATPLRWGVRFCYWPAWRRAALARCAATTFASLAVLGATLHVAAFLAAAYLIHGQISMTHP